MEWQPIETASKDEETWILACRAGSKIPFVTCWDDGWFTFNLCWEENIGKRTGRDWQPTHWMPLPEPPKD